MAELLLQISQLDKGDNAVQGYDTIIVITAKDFRRIGKNVYTMINRLPGENVIFIGNIEVGKLVEELECENVGYIDENKILDFDVVYEFMNKRLSSVIGEQELPRAVVGWYYQQFLKMEYSFFTDNKFYLVWDGDTIPCKEFGMFNEDGIPYFDMKNEYHEEYFKTIEKILPGLGKIIKRSFISEHMLINSQYMKELIETIEKNDNIEGDKYWQKILNAIEPEKLLDNSFSEFETYGTFIAAAHTTSYKLRTWHSFRWGSNFFVPEEMTDDDYEWLSKDFYAISFEKDGFILEENKNLFNNKYYQSKLTARQMLEAAQEVSTGYKEVWE